MLFRWAKRNPVNYRLMEILQRDWNSIRVVDLNHPEFIPIGSEIHDTDDLFVGVARVGLFTEDMMYVNIPHLNWFCNDQGSIWPVWSERLPYKGDRWYKARKRHLRQSRKRGDETPGVGDYYEDMEMIGSVRATLEKYTRELWIQHKMASDTLLKGPFVRPGKPVWR